MVYTVERQPRPLLSEMMALTEVPSLRIPPRSRPPAELTSSAPGRARIGHVPVTAVEFLADGHRGGGVAPVLALWCCATSAPASWGNLVWRGREVNHQWSKSLGAEALLRDALRGHAGLDQR